MKKIRKIILLIIIFFSVFVPKIYAEETIEEQKEEFGIKDFVNNSKEYAGDFFEDIDINEILESAIKGEVDNSSIFKKILNIFRKRNNRCH